ncbi:amino acid/amide ABC transporter membrane protein 2, HAAT family /amino acid/amide ABC transporter ATP-binding protein 1, HAAT family [Rhizobiales bacterium GAS191]|jgi:branched-chain amino acid transport system permease protein|nr:amino acid/amide ABC transporter membrane protein 2, HAAT family /amino acid/amide ABC transporter ATP-binding protein 1, HAAT family [Rhizobiales bacterium GAS113]SEC06232.1 amino acid/amide ABC transporter membrane protein 2, HAAT family /amino acid/amide ABC transporter ATP-binding protein 1, HAAT family [Rhizobiales bacterium GAS191]
MSRLPPLIALAVAILVPLLPGLPPFWVTLLDYIGLYAIVAIGLVVLTGVGGMTSFGQAMFVGFGAYTTAILTTRYGISPWATLPIAVLITACAAYLIGAITLRLSGHYLPVGTIAWNISFYYITGNLDFFRRYDGISGIPPLSIAGISFIDSAKLYYLILLVVVLAILATQNLLDSRIGRAIRALRGGAIAAESCGVDTSSAKIFAFVYAAVLASVSGWLYAHMQRAVNPSPFNIEASIEYLLMAVVGGAGHVWGALLGAGIVTIIKDQLQDLLPKLVGQQGNYEIIVFGVILVAILQTAPDGLWPLIVRPFRRLGKSASRQARAAVEALARREAPQRGNALLEVKGLRKTYGGLVAVNDIDFSVAGGEIVSLIGPNGAGKTTTFNLITGVDRPSAGEVRFGSRAITNLPPRLVARLGLARTFQHVRLIAAMSVIDNVAIGAHLRGHAGALSGIARLDRTEEARLFQEARRQLERVGLLGEADKPATSLALGQQRIVEIARALCLDPTFLLLDEPAAGLRHQEKAALAGLLRKLGDEGVAILLVEHDMDFVMGLCERVIVMNFGSKLAEGTPAEIGRDPAVVEAYLGAVA